jgi:hypothetical protein
VKQVARREKIDHQEDRRRRKEDIKMGLGEIEWGIMDSIHLTGDRDEVAGSC